MEIETNVLYSHKFEVIPTQDHHLDVKVRILKSNRGPAILVNDLRDGIKTIQKALAHKKDCDAKIVELIEKVLKW